MTQIFKMFPALLVAFLFIGPAHAADDRECLLDVDDQYSHVESLYEALGDRDADFSEPLAEDATCDSEFDALQQEARAIHDSINGDDDIQESTACVSWCSVCGACIKRAPEEPFEIITKNAAVSVIG